MKLILQLFLLYLLLSFVLSKKKKKKIKLNKKVPKNSVQKKKLIRVDVSAKAILSNYNESHSSQKYHPYRGEVLAFITPWNKQGLDNAIKFKHKFTMISPTLFNILPDIDPENPESSVAKYKIDGIEQAGQYKSWVTEIQDSCKVLPRFRFIEFKSKEDFLNFFINIDIIDRIVEAVYLNGYDGVVMEFGYFYYEKVLNNFFKRLREKLGPTKTVVLAVPPLIPSRAAFFSHTDLYTTRNWIDFVILMCYDFQGEALSPVNWVKRSIENLIGADQTGFNNKILVGIQWYGYKFYEEDGEDEKKPVMGNDYIDILKKYKPKIKWDDVNKEHYSEIKSKESFRVRYPSLKFLETRINLAKEYGIGGISIWEIGQGK